MTNSLARVLLQLADHAAVLNESFLAHLLRTTSLEASLSKLPAPRPVIGLWDWDLPNDLAYLDPTCARLFGVEPNKGLPSTSWISAIHPADRGIVADAI